MSIAFKIKFQPSFGLNWSKLSKQNPALLRNDTRLTSLQKTIDPNLEPVLRFLLRKRENTERVRSHE